MTALSEDAVADIAAATDKIADALAPVIFALDTRIVAAVLLSMGARQYNACFRGDVYDGATICNIFVSALADALKQGPKPKTMAIDEGQVVTTQ